MTNKLSIGVLGASNFARRQIIPEIQGNELLELAGVASRTIESHPDFKVFSDYEGLVKSEDVQAVYIPLPNSLHYEWICKSLNAGKHVLCEKSLCSNLHEVQEVTSLARERNLVLMENFHFRYHPQLAEIRKLIDTGSIGEIRCVRSYFGFPPFPDKDNIRYSKELGGGALLDAGAYPLRMALELLGQDVQVLSATAHSRLPYEVDIWGSTHLSANGVDCLAAFGFENYYQCMLEVWGSEGMISTDRIFTAKPDYEPVIQLSNAEGKSEIRLEPFNTYAACVERFRVLASDVSANASEYNEEHELNCAQAALLEACRSHI